MARRVPATSPGLRNRAMSTCFSAPETGWRTVTRLRLNREIGHAQALILEGIALGINAQRQVILQCLTDGHQAIGQPIAQPITVEQGHDHVNIGLELDQALTLIG